MAKVLNLAFSVKNASFTNYRYLPIRLKRPFFTTFEHAHTDTWPHGLFIARPLVERGLIHILLVVYRFVSFMERTMHLRKVCPQCNTILHARWSVCGCGHAFPLKRKGQCIADKLKSQVMKRKRTLETELETLLRRQKDKVRKVSMRAPETAEETLHRKESNYGK